MKSRNVGFTLIELLVVIAVISILSAIGLVFLNGGREKARIADAQSDLRSIATALQILEFDTGEWPNHLAPGICTGACGANEVEDLTVAAAGLMVTDGNFPSWQGPYLKTMPLDPWEHQYFLDTDYRISGQDYAVLGSYGPNGVGLNQYDEDDVYFILAQP